MKARFCPECGEECLAEHKECPTCSFPLELNLTSRDGKLYIGKENNWSRIAKLLSKGGIRVQILTNKGPDPHQMWWILPIFGMLILLATILFGEGMATKIWGAPLRGQAPILDLSGQAKQEEPKENATPSTDFLVEALKTTEEQKQLTNNGEDDFLYEAEVSESRIQLIMEEAFLRMQIEDNTYNATRFPSYGYVLTRNKDLLQAFKTKIVTIQEGGQMRQERRRIVPVVRAQGGSPAECDPRDESDILGIGLLQANFSEPTTFEAEFFTETEISQPVWILDGRGLHPQATRELVRNIDTTGNGTKVLTLSGSIEALLPGSPVLNTAGRLIGIATEHRGSPAFIPFWELRERAPRLYKNMINN